MPPFPFHQPLNLEIFLKPYKHLLVVAHPTNANIVGCKWIFKVNRNSDGTIKRYKAKIVSKGFSHEGVDFFESFSPVIILTTIQFIYVVLSQDWRTRQLDINTTFLNDILTKEVYMEQPHSFENPCHPHVVCKLHKALYELKKGSYSLFQPT